MRALSATIVVKCFEITKTSSSVSFVGNFMDKLTSEDISGYKAQTQKQTPDMTLTQHR
jgi:hypothetical protein